LNLRTSDDDDNYDSYGRGYIVNWSSLTGNTGNRTIEFRQHSCVLEIPELNQWIDFLFACVRTAERLADTGVLPNVSPDATYAEQKGAKYS